MSKDYYKILGIDKNASKEEIKKAYKKLAKQYHPDINKEANAADKFKEINEAASVLADEQKREKYDKFGTADAADFSGFDFRDSGFSSGDFDFGDIFDMFFGGGFTQGGFGRRNTRGSDLRFDIELGLEEIAEGTEKTIMLERLEKCPDCNGKGAKNNSDIITCPECHGSGRATKTRRTPFGIFQTTSTCDACYGEGKAIKNPCKNCGGKGRAKKNSKIKISIPAGVEEGMRLRVSEEGEAGIREGRHGDLYVIIHVKPHKLFIRDGDDINVAVPISFTQAALGDTIEVPLLDGKQKLRIPPGTQPGTVFRIKGAGIPRLNGYGAGDQNIKVNLDVPTHLSKKQKELLEEFAKESGDNAEPNKGFFKSIFDKL